VDEQLQQDFNCLREENAQLQAENGKLLHQADRLQLMCEVAANVASTLDLKELLPKIMTDATRVMEAEASSLMLLDEATNELVFEVALGARGEEIKAIRVPMGQGLAGWVAQHGVTQLVPDVDQDPRVKKLTSMNMRSMLCAPLMQNGQVIGIVQVINKLHAAGLSFTEDDIPSFEAFADQSATAVSQARAHQELAIANLKLEAMFDNTIRAMSATLDARDQYTQGHSQRVTDFGLAIAEELGITGQEFEDLRLAGLLHDVGKIGVPDYVLLKNGKLTDDEYDLMKKHPVIGYDIVSGIPELHRSLPGIRNHHERMDGRGYPDKLAGDDIPLFGRILAVADCFDAMTSTRAYRARFDDTRALEMIGETRGTQHDPVMVDCLLVAFQQGKVLTQSKRSEYTDAQASVPARDTAT